MASALTSLAFDQPIKNDLAMTGELTLTGKVLKVGGIKEKVIAARREKVTTLLLPRQNEADYTELKDYLKAGITAHFVDHYDDVYRFAFEDGEVPPLRKPPRGLPVITITEPAMPISEEVGDTTSSTDASSGGPEQGGGIGELPVPPSTPVG